MDTKLFLQLLKRFGNVPFRNGKCGLGLGMDANVGSLLPKMVGANLWGAVFGGRRGYKEGWREGSGGWRVGELWV